VNLIPGRRLAGVVAVLVRRHPPELDARWWRNLPLLHKARQV